MKDISYLTPIDLPGLPSYVYKAKIRIRKLKNWCTYQYQRPRIMKQTQKVIGKELMVGEVNSSRFKLLFLQDLVKFRDYK